MKLQVSAWSRLPFVTLLLLLIAPVSNANERVVSLNGSLTEIVYALDQQHRLVGVDTTSQYPVAATKLTSVGYQRALSAEGIISLQPTLILSTNHAGPDAALQQITALGVERVQLDETYTLDGVLDKIHQVATALEVQEQGQLLAERVSADAAKAADAIPSSVSTPKVLFFLGTGSGSPSVAGGQTAANAMINLAGGENPFQQAYTGYKPVNAEAIIQAKPDVILVSARAFQSNGGLEGVLALPGVISTPAGQDKKVYAVDTLLTLGFGPRLPEAISTLVSKLHGND